MMETVILFVRVVVIAALLALDPIVIAFPVLIRQETRYHLLVSVKTDIMMTVTVLYVLFVIQIV